MPGHLQVIAFLQNMGTGEWMVILILGLLVFGKRLPDVARSLGKSVNEFKKGMREFQDSAQEVASDVSTATNEAMSEADVHASQTTYEATSSSDMSQTTGELAPESGEQQIAGASTSQVEDPSSPTELDPHQSTPTDSCQADSQETDTKRPDAAGSYEPMS